MHYFNIVVFFIFAFVLSFVLALVPYFFAKRNSYKAKLAPYECGVCVESDSRKKFDMKFYLVAIVFMIFDIEIIFLFPLVPVLREVGIFGFLSMMLFLFVVIVGFIYEWKRGVLEW